MSTAADAVVIGIGNALAGDDAAGLAVARLVRELGPVEVAVIEFEGEPSRIVDLWAGADLAIVVDAVRSSAAPGTVIRLDATTTPLPAELHRSSTHALGVGDAVELARALGRLPPRLVVYGIAGAQFEAGAPLSPAVAGVIDHVARRILEETCPSS